MRPPTLWMFTRAVLQAEPSVAAYAVPLLQARAVSVPSLTLSYAAIGAFRCVCMTALWLDALDEVMTTQRRLHWIRACCRCSSLPVLRRGLRDTKTPLWGTAASTVVNYGLHILFMGSYGWGVLGAGWAVVWGQVACFLSLETTSSIKICQFQ